ncbi:MAG: ATP synthase F1 subunit delta [Bacilli bacterium]|nr:ATP synthase F1 subunit delta [Bacilli bacterium]
MEELFSNYANALYGLIDRDKSEEYLSVLQGFCLVLNENPEANQALSSPNLSKDEKDKIVDICLGKNTLPHIKAFLMLIISHHRVRQLGGIVDAFQSLVDEAKGRRQGIVYSSTPLSEKQIKELEQAFQKRNGYEVRLKNKVDETLLGGLKVALDGKVYDGSLKAKLLELQKTLKK